MNKEAPKYLFISLQLHPRKSGEVAETGAISVGVKVSDGSLKNERKWKSVDIGGNRCEKICQMFPRCFPKSTGNGETKYK